MSWYQLTLLEEKAWDFPGDPVIKTLSFHCRECKFHPWLVQSLVRELRCHVPCSLAEKRERERERERLTLKPRLFLLLCHCFPWPTDQMQVGQQKGWTMVMVKILSLPPKGKLYSGIGKFVNRQKWSMREMGVPILLWFEHLCSPKFTSKWWHWEAGRLESD